MKRWILGLVTVAAISLVGAATASAQGYGGYGCGAPSGGYSAGYGGHSAGYGGYSAGYAPGYNAYSGNGGYAAGFGGSNLNYGGTRWHDTSHLDYHPGSIQRHRLHFHYVPGHYDLHRSGHRH